MTIHVVGISAIHTGYMEVAPPFNKTKDEDINLLILEFPKEKICISDPLGVPCCRIVGQCTHKFAARTKPSRSICPSFSIQAPPSLLNPFAVFKRLLSCETYKDTSCVFNSHKEIDSSSTGWRGFSPTVGILTHAVGPKFACRLLHFYVARSAPLNLVIRAIFPPNDEYQRHEYFHFS